VEEVRALCERLLAMPDVRFADQATGLVLLGVLHAMGGRADEGRRRLEEADSLKRRVGLHPSPRDRGVLETYAGDLEVAEREFRLAEREYEESGNTLHLGVIRARIAQVVSFLGRDDEALELAESALRVGSDDPWVPSLAGGTRARVLARQGRLGEALQVAADTVAHSRSAQLHLTPHIFGSALEDLAFVLARAGRIDEADKALREALDLYERKGIVPWVARVRAARDELRKAPAVRPL
jgi:Flp pilus assembly protein TadD